jgi:hypothetical protein
MIQVICNSILYMTVGSFFKGSAREKEKDGEMLKSKMGY